MDTPITKQLKKLKAAKAKLELLKKSIASRMEATLANLPTEHGFESVSAFIKAVRAAARNKSGRPKSSKSTRKNKKRRKRQTITEGTRAAVKLLLEDNKPIAGIAKALKISVSSVNLIKKSLGLVKSRKK